jgi:hypothetical protein
MALTRITPDRTLRRARIATSVIFAAHGAVTGTFAARVPWISPAGWCTASTCGRSYGC